MAGADNNALAIEVAINGCLGSRGMGYNSPTKISEEVLNLRKEISQFNINLFVPTPFHPLTLEQRKEKEKAVNMLITFLYPHAETLNCEEELSNFDSNVDLSKLFNDQIETLLNLKPSFLSLTFGLLSQDVLKAFQEQGVKVLATATNLNEGKLIISQGYDAIVAQGFEAGGHRGSFLLNEFKQMSTLDLVQALASDCTLPIIAAGGIRRGQQIMGLYQAGASAVQIGTAFLACSDCVSIPKNYQHLIINSGEQTQTTDAVSGRHARCTPNKLYEVMSAFKTQFPEESKLLPYPFPHLKCRCEIKSS